MPDPTDSASVPLPCFALKPLSNRAVSLQDVGIRPIDPTTGRFGPPTAMNFASVDPEPWALAFLTDLDRSFEFRSFEPGRVQAAHRAAPAALSDLAQARLDIAAAIAGSLDVVRATDDDTGLAAARISLRERLIVSLARGFAIAASTRITGGDGTAVTLFADGEGRRPTAPLNMLPGRPRIPAPLRELPPSPTIVGVEARGPAAPASLAEAVRWSYVLTIACRAAPQDRLRIQPTAGETAPAGGAATASGELFALLAQYTVVAGDLRALLDGLTAEAPAPAVVGALETWAGLARAIAQAWTAHAAATPAPAPTTGPEPPAYVLTFESTAEDDGLAALHLRRTGRMEAFDWPDLVLTPATGEPLPLIADEEGDDDLRMWRLAPGALNAFTEVTLELLFADIPAGRIDRVQTALRLDRNVTLPDTNGAATNPAFVYRGAPVETPSVTPSLSGAGRLDIGAWSDDPAANPLSTAIQTIFDGEPDDRPFRLEIAYGYRLADSTLESFVPMLLAEDVTFAGLGEVAAAMTQWRAATQPSTDGAFWRFSILVRTGDPAAAMLMSLPDLASPIAPQG